MNSLKGSWQEAGIINSVAYLKKMKAFQTKEFMGPFGLFI